MIITLNEFFTGLAWLLLISFLIYSFFKIIFVIIEPNLNNENENNNNENIIYNENNSNQNKVFVRILIILFIIPILFYFGFTHEFNLEPNDINIEKNISYDNIIGKYIVLITPDTNYYSIKIRVNFYDKNNNILSSKDEIKYNLEKNNTYTYVFTNDSLFSNSVKIESIYGTKKGLIQFIKGV